MRGLVLRKAVHLVLLSTSIMATFRVTRAVDKVASVATPEQLIRAIRSGVRHIVLQDHMDLSASGAAGLSSESSQLTIQVIQNLS